MNSKVKWVIDIDTKYILDQQSKNKTKKKAPLITLGTQIYLRFLRLVSGKNQDEVLHPPKSYASQD